MHLNQMESCILLTTKCFGKGAVNVRRETATAASRSPSPDLK